MSPMQKAGQGAAQAEPSNAAAQTPRQSIQCTQKPKLKSVRYVIWLRALHSLRTCRKNIGRRVQRRRPPDVHEPRRSTEPSGGIIKSGPDVQPGRLFYASFRILRLTAYRAGRLCTASSRARSQPVFPSRALSVRVPARGPLRRRCCGVPWSGAA